MPAGLVCLTVCLSVSVGDTMQSDFSQGTLCIGHMSVCAGHYASVTVHMCTHREHYASVMQGMEARVRTPDRFLLFEALRFC